MKKYFFLFLLYYFIVAIILFDRTGGYLKGSLEVGAYLSVCQILILHFYELFWKTYTECLDKERKTEYSITDEKEN